MNETYRMAGEDIAALSTLLGDQSYYLSEEPHSVDAVVFGLIANIIWTPIESPLKQQTGTSSNLIAFCEWMRSGYFPELSEYSHQ